MLTATTTAGRKVTFDEKPIGNGAEKVVFFSQDRKEVVCFFNSQLKSRGERLNRLTRLNRDYNPTINGAHAEYWRQHFCWPNGVIDGDPNIPTAFLDANGLLKPALAITAPVFRDNFFFTNTLGKKVEGDVSWFVNEKSRQLVPDAHRGSLLTYIRVLTKLARAVRRMHMAGLAHSDLSNRNVLIDPKSGDCCIIDIDSLVVPHFAPPLVKGTQGYIAPEVVMDRIMEDNKPALPCIQTDLYALGVLIYECLLFRHPIRRHRPINHLLPSDEDDRLAFGKMALFREHPTDKNNHPKVPPVMQIKHLGPHLAELMLRLFVDGLHDRSQRPTASLWESALYRTADLLHPTQDGTLKPGPGTDFFILAPKMAMEVPQTRERLTKPVPYARWFEQGPGNSVRPAGAPGKYVRNFQYSVTIWNQRPLYEWQARTQLFPNENCPNRDPVGQFQFHNGNWFLTNLASYEFKTADGKVIRKNEFLTLTPKLRVQMYPGPLGRIFEFDFMNP